MAETETQEQQNWAWDSLISNVSNVAIAGLGFLEAKEQAEPTPVSTPVAVTAVSEATPVPASVGTNNNGTTVVQPNSMGGVSQKTMLIGGGALAVGLVLILALRK